MFNKMAYTHHTVSDYSVFFPWLDIPPYHSVNCVWLKYLLTSEDITGQGIISHKCRSWSKFHLRATHAPLINSELLILLFAIKIVSVFN